MDELDPGRSAAATGLTGLADAEASWRSLEALGAAAIGVWEWDYRSGHLHWDRRVAEIYGVTPASFDGGPETLLERVHPEDRPRLARALQRARDTGDQFAEEFRVTRPDGSTGWVMGRGRAIRDEHGNPLRMVGIGFDSTELRSGREQVARTLDHVTDGVVILDQEWRFSYMNGAAERLLLRDAGELLGEVVWEMFADVPGTVTFDRFQAAARDQVGDSFEVYYGPLNGWFELRLFPAPDGMTVYFRNVDARRRFEAEREELVTHLSTSLARAYHVEGLSNALSHALSAAEVAAIVVDAARRSLGAVFAGPALISDDGREIRFVSLDPLPDQTAEDWSLVPITEDMPLTEAARLKTPLFHSSRDEMTARYPHLAGAMEVAGTHAFANVALMTSGRVIGTLSMAWDEPRDFSDEDKAFIATLANQCALALERALLFEQQRGAAETLALAILPERLPELSGWELHARYLPASLGAQVGGDFYDAYEVEGQLVITVGDVAGHGLRAAAVMGQVRNAMRGFALDHLDADEVMSRVRKLVRIHEPDELLTMLFGVIDPATGILRWANAGHPPPLVLPAEGPGAFLADAPCGPVGAPPPPNYPRSTHYARLAPGESMLWYTDGLVERRGESLSEGFDRLLDVVGSVRLSAPHAIDQVVDGLRPHQGWEDDVCVLSVRRLPN